MQISGSAMGCLQVFRRTSETATGQSSFMAVHITSGDMVDGFGSGFAFAVEDATSGMQTIGAIYALRDGADNTGRLSLRVANGGFLSEVFGVSAAGAARFNQAFTFPTADGNANQVLVTDGEGNVTWADQTGGGDTFVDRGDPAAWDFDVNDLTTDGTWRDLDLSGIVPAGAKAVLLGVQIRANDVNSTISFRENGNSNVRNVFRLRVQVSSIRNDGCSWVACDTNRVIEYNADDVAWTNILTVVRGWLI